MLKKESKIMKAEFLIPTKTEVPDINTNNITGNQEQPTEIDPKQLMKENAELFKELLGEA